MLHETRFHVPLLWSHTALFAFRVAAQLLQYAHPIASLPPFEAWQGSGLSYPVLLASQVVILIIMVAGANRIARGVRPARRIGVWLLAFGGVYFVAMALRLVLGVTLLADVAWFAKLLPAVFHLVLAGYILTLGHYHWQGSRADVPSR